MKHADFSIGTRFWTSTGQCWCCTDVGRRTITAIELQPDLDPAWHCGPPYAVSEVVFDERDIDGAFLSYEDAIQSALAQADEDLHPGYPNPIVKEMVSTSLLDAALAYPRQWLFRIDRVDAAGELLHPYAALPEHGGWRILLYAPFTETFSALPEQDFVRLRPATSRDLETRKQVALQEARARGA